jgi:uncharacterized protein (DUF1501 family)
MILFNSTGGIKSMKISRRDFLKGTATSLFLAGFNLPALASTSRKKNLVVIMLRGGMDGLCAVPVIGDKNFEKRRKKILIESPIKLDSDFALHPRLDGFHECWKENSGSISACNKYSIYSKITF